MSRNATRIPLCWLSLTFTLLASTQYACTRTDVEVDRLPNVLLVVVDTLRADRVLPRLARGAAVAAHLTPFLDELATRGATFENTYTPTPWTSPSVATLFTSRYPLQHGVARYDSTLAPGEVTLAEELGESGYACAGFSANLYITQHLGYAQGFDAWHTYLGDPDGEIKPRAGTLIDAALDWVSSRRASGDERPGFLYLQFLEPHSPYEPPEPHRERVAPAASRREIRRANADLGSFHFSAIDDRKLELLRSLYDGEVAFFDTALEDLFARLEPTGFLDNAVVIVTSDHGEEFREHGSMLHGLSLFEPAVRVPLLIVGNGIDGGQHVAQAGSTLDVAVTVLDLLGLEQEPHFEGKSLVPLMRRSAIAGRPAPGVAERSDGILLELSHRGGAEDVRQHSWGLVSGGKKLLIDAAGAAWIYDLDVDPVEHSPEAAESSEGGRTLLVTLARLRADLESRAGPVAARVELDVETRRRLRALGYAVD